MMTKQQQLDALENAIALGARKVKFDDVETEYRTVKEMEMIASGLRRALGQKRRGRRFQRSTASKGIRP